MKDMHLELIKEKRKIIGWYNEKMRVELNFRHSEMEQLTYCYQSFDVLWVQDLPSFVLSSFSGSLSWRSRKGVNLSFQTYILATPTKVSTHFPIVTTKPGCRFSLTRLTLYVHLWNNLSGRGWSMWMDQGLAGGWVHPYLSPMDRREMIPKGKLGCWG